MKISITLDQRKSGLTSDGFPIIVHATQNYEQKTIRIGYRAKKTEWSSRLALPKSNHPQYYELLDTLELIKKNISKILIRSIQEPIPLSGLNHQLFKKDYTVFYEAAMAYLGEGDRSTKWSAVQSFEKANPNVAIGSIDRVMVESYIASLLNNGSKPSGVDSYVRSLRALWNVICDRPNPFAKHSIEIPDKVNRMPVMADLAILEGAELSYKGTVGGSGRYRDYWLLMFYLGGIDPEVLAKLRYDRNVSNGRLVFNRDKGRSKVACNCIIPQQAWRILKRYECGPYLVPIFRAKNYENFRANFARRFKEVCVSLNLSEQLRPKGARFFFIHRAQQLLIDERITAQIVGHRRKTVTSLYANDFALAVQDEAHLKIITE